MKISTAFFGKQEIDPDTIITFPDGIPGFEELKQYKLFSEEEKSTVMWLQSVDSADIVFSVANPATFNLGYEIVLSDEEANLIELESADDAEILLILRKRAERQEGDIEVAAVGSNVHANIKGPLVVNTRKRLGVQKVLPEIERYTVIREESAQAE